MNIGKNSKKKFLGRVILLILSIIIALLISEYITCQILDFNYYIVEGVHYEFNKALEKGTFIPHDILGYVPGDFWKREGKLGFQNGKGYKNFGNGAVDVAILGDSIIQYRTLEKSFKYLLKNENFRIWNVGISGYNTLQEAYYLKKFIKFHPDILILGFCKNDYRPSMLIVSNEKKESNKFVQSLFEPLGYCNPFLFHHFALYSYIKTNNLLLTKKEVYTEKGIIKNSRVVKKGLKKIKNYCKKNGIFFIVIVYSHLHRDYPKDWEKKLMI